MLLQKAALVKHDLNSEYFIQKIVQEMEFNFVVKTVFKKLLNRVSSLKRIELKEPPCWHHVRSLKIKLKGAFVFRLYSDHIKHKGFKRSYFRKVIKLIFLVVLITPLEGFK